MNIKAIFIFLCICICTSLHAQDNPLILSEYTSYQFEEPLITERTTYQYNEFEQLTEKIRFAIDDNNENLDTLEVELYTYTPNNGLLLKKIYYQYSVLNETQSNRVESLYDYFESDCIKTIEHQRVKDGEVFAKHIEYYAPSCEIIYTPLDYVPSDYHKDSIIYHERGTDGIFFIRQQNYYTYEEGKQIINAYGFDGDLVYTNEDELNEDGYVTKHTQYQLGSLVTESIYTYDDANNLLQKDTYYQISSSKRLYNRFVSEYNADNNPIKKLNYSYQTINDSLQVRIETERLYTYDETGTLVEWIRRNRQYDLETALPNEWITQQYKNEFYCDGLRKILNIYDTDDVLKGTYNFYYLKGIDCEEDNLPPLSLVAYPNPATDYVTLNSDIFFQENSTLNLYDATGKLILQANISQRVDNYTFSTQNLSKGMYLIRVISGEDVFIHKFFRE